MGLMNQKPKEEKKISMARQYYRGINTVSVHSLIHSYFLSASHIANTMMVGNPEVRIYRLHSPETPV